MRTRWNIFKKKIGSFKVGRVNNKTFFSSAMAGDGEGLTESFFTLISEDKEKEWLPSVVLRANKDFPALAPSTRDKCLTEGYSPSCGILMISRHTPISLVVHEARWHTQCSGLSVRAIHCVSTISSEVTIIELYRPKITFLQIFVFILSDLS